MGLLLKLSLGGKRLGKCVVSESLVSSGWSELWADAQNYSRVIKLMGGGYFSVSNDCCLRGVFCR